MDAQSERRVVTCLFIDVVGSTDLMMRLGPELMRRRLSDAFAQMSSRITAMGGSVENYIGDAVFALFGAPVAHADDPERALRAAQACAEWSTDALADDRLAIRVGIETGEALIDLAAVAKRERMAIGACVNIAARLQQQAAPGEIVVGPTCAAVTTSVAVFTPLGPLDLKGLGQLEAWRFEKFAAVGAEPHAVPFVGRERELAQLVEAAQRTEAQNRAALALILGDPGLGKSRLAEEAIRRRRASASVHVIQVRCRPAGEVDTHTPLRQLIETQVPHATRDSVREHLERVLASDEATTLAGAISHSAGLGADPRLLALPRFEQREVIAEAWRRYLASLAAAQPIMLLVEDVHWADPVLVRTLDHLTAALEAPVFVIATARPEFAETAHLGVASNRVEIELGPLDEADSAALAAAARGGSSGLGRAAGNPLFIIELARSRTTDAELPLTLQAAIAARLDELSVDERQLLQYVAVAGESFDARDAALLDDRDAPDIAGMLGRIAHLGFIVPVGAGYRFHHALVRDVAYGRLPITERLTLHARYAERGVALDNVEARAYHLWQAAGPPEAAWAWEADRFESLRSAGFEAYMAAGERLEGRNQYEQAFDAYDRALQLTSEPAQAAAARSALGRALTRQALGDEAWAQRLMAIEGFKEAGMTAPAELYADMLEIVSLNWGYFKQMPPEDQVHGLLDEGERIARESGDEVSLARLLTDRAAFTSDPSAVDEVMRLVDSAEGVPFADAAQRLAQVLLWAGRFDRSLELYGKVFDELIPAGAVINEPEALTWYGLAAFQAGDLKLARSVAGRFRELAEGRSPHTRSHLLGLVGMIEAGAGEWDRVKTTAGEVEQLVAANPGASFCLIGCAAVGYGAAASMIGDQPMDTDLAALAQRMVPRSEVVRASSIMLPLAMLGDAGAVEAGLKAYEPGQGLLDRAGTWDVAQIVPAIVMTMHEMWDLTGGPLARLDECAAGGSRLAAAVAAAIQEQRTAPTSSDSPRPGHRDLLALGYRGTSELLRFRPAGDRS